MTNYRMPSAQRKVLSMASDSTAPSEYERVEEALHLCRKYPGAIDPYVIAAAVREALRLLRQAREDVGKLSEYAPWEDNFIRECRRRWGLK